MTDTISEAHDDAPQTTSKDKDAAERARRDLVGGQGSTITGRSVNINRPRHELWAYWRDFANLSTFMENIVRIDVRDTTNSHWVVKGPMGTTVEWDAIVTDEKQGEYIAWTSAPGADVANSGRIDFRDATGGRGTVVMATIAYDPPAGVIGKLVATLMQREPGLQARRDLRRFKQLMETGEIAVSSRTRADAKAEKE